MRSNEGAGLASQRVRGISNGAVHGFVHGDDFDISGELPKGAPAGEVALHDAKVNLAAADASGAPGRDLRVFQVRALDVVGSPHLRDVHHAWLDKAIGADAAAGVAAPISERLELVGAERHSKAHL
jgi:hypothetical protein